MECPQHNLKSANCNGNHAVNAEIPTNIHTESAETGSEVQAPRSKQNPGTRDAGDLTQSSALSVSKMPPQHWRQEWQHYQHHNPSYSFSGGHVSTRHGLDVSNLVFGSILRDYIRTPAASPAMGDILNRFLQYDLGIFLNVRALSSISRFTVKLKFFLCRINPTTNIMALQGREILLSSTSSIVSDCHRPTPQLSFMQRGTLNLFIGYVAMNIHMQWSWL